MSNFTELCLRRQSCRKFTDKPAEHEKLVACVETGHLAPSGCNSQPWSFVVVETPEIVAEVAKCGQQIGMNPWLSTATAFIVVLEEHAVLMPAIRKVIDSQYFAKGDLGAATVHVCLEAEAQGLGSCIIGIYDRETLGKLLNIPAEKQFAALIALGYAADDTVRPKSRKPLDEIARFV
ncbi:MAG: nitroreductase family protein [Oscillospiraceae bacterium]|nr:nitroreductase family protein [Oscillospiraceae bacterium]